MTLCVTLLGTGGPKPDPDRMGPAVLISAGDKNYLIDAGRGVTTRLLQADLQPENLDAIFITHHHFDHIGNLGDLILSIWNNGRVAPLPIYGPHGTAKIITAMITQVYATDIAFRMREAEITGGSLTDITEMLNIHEIGAGGIFDDGTSRFSAAHVCHGHGLGMTHAQWPCLGYRIETCGKTIAISGDTVDCEGLQTLAENADLLVLCCYLAADEQNDFERDVVSKHILVSSAQAGKIAAKTHVKTLAVTHIRAKSDALLNAMKADIEKDFAGNIHIGHDLLQIMP